MNDSAPYYKTAKVSNVLKKEMDPLISYQVSNMIPRRGKGFDSAETFDFSAKLPTGRNLSKLTPVDSISTLLLKSVYFPKIT